MTEQITMAPCPFCEGPPCVIAKDYMTGKEVEFDRPLDEYSEENYSAYVWCHECGAQGPVIDSCTLGIFEGLHDLTVMAVARIAVERWNERGSKARACYDGGAKDGLNLFPRSEA
ncbi:Lar family restriction alleviation protein [Pseudomonas sp. KSR10]|uniref:Lar family restriction alleviation protein n=1 Tax=Pseudomonas sp. KSR10 TaxID=2916654 RepID=UPI001EF999B0|nr:Lar family restriction alleviation protein [Pseudomonas sp. KSR10]MCG6540192.1 Lar family restriction alleviation protein [Pseudomonas sp. KSR10]